MDTIHLHVVKAKKIHKTTVVMGRLKIKGVNSRQKHMDVLIYIVFIKVTSQAQGCLKNADVRYNTDKDKVFYLRIFLKVFLKAGCMKEICTIFRKDQLIFAIGE